MPSRGRPGRLALVAAAVVAALLVVLVSAAAESSVEIGQGWTPGIGGPAEPDQAEAAETTVDAQRDSPYGVQVVSAVLLLVLLLVMLAFALFGLIALVLGAHRIGARRRPAPPAGVSVDSEDDDERLAFVMRAAVAKAMASFDERHGGEPGDAVVAAWLALEEAAADAGARREPHHTPTEFTASVLARLDVDAGALARLRRVYHRARFSSRGVTVADAAVARDALTRVVADLDTGRPATATVE